MKHFTFLVFVFLTFFFRLLAILSQIWDRPANPFVNQESQLVLRNVDMTCADHTSLKDQSSIEEVSYIEIKVYIQLITLINFLFYLATADFMPSHRETQNFTFLRKNFLGLGESRYRPTLFHRLG